MYLYLPSENSLISNEGSYSLDNFDKFDIPKKYNIWKELLKLNVIILHINTYMIFMR